MGVLCSQINSAASTYCKIILTGDANLCSEKWMLDGYERKSVAQPLQHCLEQNGLLTQKVGYTYQSDRTLPNGEIPRSALDHVYNSVTINEAITVKTHQNSSTDHLPVIIRYSLNLAKVTYKRSLTKRSFKKFTKEVWNEALEQEDWV